MFIYSELEAFWHPLLGHYSQGAKLKLTCTMIMKTDLLSAKNAAAADIAAKVRRPELSTFGQGCKLGTINLRPRQTRKFSATHKNVLLFSSRLQLIPEA